MANIELREGFLYFVVRTMAISENVVESKSMQALFSTKLSDTGSGRRHIYLTDEQGNFLYESTAITGGKLNPEHGNPVLYTASGAVWHFNPPRNAAGKKYKLPNSK